MLASTSRPDGVREETQRPGRVAYRIVALHPEAHRFEVRCTVIDPVPDGQCFALPAWIPGSYLVRDFARHVVSINATSGGKSILLRKLDKHTWQCAPCRGTVTIILLVYAFDLSVRGAYLDTQRGFFNGAAVFLRPLGHEHLPCSVEIVAPSGPSYRSWRVATALLRDGASAHGFGAYRAENYDDLIDHPVEIGEFTLARFRACGVTHEVAISGRHDTDLRRLTRDLKRICEAQIGFFSGRLNTTPFDRYLFLINAQGEGYGGLEHRASTALLCSRHELPHVGAIDNAEGYRRFLGLASHEYFHAWNVKRMRPQAFSPYNLKGENHTTLLWVFEGITSYYDDLFLVRSGLISPQAYLDTLARNITNLLRTPGRTRQTLAEASWDAWIKYYRQDEDSPNSQVSYYLKGALVALCLDLLIRHKTRHRKSLDHVMRAMWNRHGKTQIGLAEDGFEKLAEEISGLDLSAFFERALRSTEELPLASLLKSVGVRLNLQFAQDTRDTEPQGGRAPRNAARQRVDLRLHSSEDAAGVRLTHVLDGGAAQRAGLCPGDVLMALDGLRLTGKNFERVCDQLRPGQSCQLHFFRRDELMIATITPEPATPDTCGLIAPVAPLPASYKAWLGL